jgi:hypothetical protein
MNMLIKNNKNEESNVKALDHEAWRHAWKFLDKFIHILKMIKEQQKIMWFLIILLKFISADRLDPTQLQSTNGMEFHLIAHLRNCFKL